ncbi:MAG: glucosaminidase domain-containing protein [Litorilituus sp.]|jgi:Bax protein|nr:glucosaminidase domain-containing protein [Litorilituus sp.]
MSVAVLNKSIFLVVILACLLAPFTFLKPKPTNKSVVEGINYLIEKSNKPVVNKSVEKPLHQVNLPNFAAIRDVKAKKQQFFDFLRPAVERENAKLLILRASLELWLEKKSLGLSLSDEELQALATLVNRYRVNKKGSVLQQVNELLIKVDIVPTALVLVQAANESAWGTSRFARVGLNFFGIWCYREGCGMIPAGRNKGAKHEVAAFKSVDEAVARYFYNLNSNNAYRVLRNIRFELRSQNQPINPEVLATGLLPYSERGSDYVIEITKMLRHNQVYLKSNPISTGVSVSE